MKWFHSLNWIKISLFNFLIVSFLGLLMRYKIGFSLPILEQKNIQHAHSHFAFTGWVSLLLMVLLVNAAKEYSTQGQQKKINVFFWTYLMVAYGSVISFVLQGYGTVSIIFSILTLVLSFYFCVVYFGIIKNKKENKALNWFIAAIFFFVISAFGTFYLSFMMASKSIEQQAYLASVYWYLHFQYNGWFFFACSGLFVQYLQQKNLLPSSINRIFWLFSLCCLPGYGLSILWLDLPFFLYIVICIAAIIQFFAVLLFLTEFRKLKPFEYLGWSNLLRFIFLFVALALLIKFLLQLGSIVPEIAKFAFGFRPIVIAYLHLVLLAFTSLFLLGYVLLTEQIHFSKTAKKGVFLLAIGVLLNEIILALQGIGSLSYTSIPYANEMLFIVALLIFFSLLIVNLSTSKK